MKQMQMSFGILARILIGVFFVSESAFSQCEQVSETIQLKWGPTSFPRAGRFVRESHYATTQETFSEGRFPISSRQNISRHLQQSCDAMKSYGFDLSSECAEIYEYRDQREWTPPEGGGSYGQAARGKLKPDVISELWQGNLMYAKGAMPPHGTKYIVTHPANGKSAVVSFGLEVGPGSPECVGGLTSEVHWYLGSDHRSILHMGRAQDQTLPLGPIDCR